MLKKLFLLSLFTAANKCCELPEHLKNKEFITIRTPDEAVGDFLSTRVQCSGLLWDLASRPNSDSGLDIDLISDKEKLLTHKRLNAILNLIGNTEVIKQWEKTHSIDLTDPFECISLVDTIKYLNLENDKAIADTFIKATTCGEHQLFNTNNFQEALHRYFKGENISLANAACYGEFCIIPPPAREIDLNDIQAPPESLENSWKVIVFNNYSPSVTFDIKKESPIQDITIINQPRKPIPSIQLKNVSGYDGLSLRLKHTDVTTEEYQQLRKILWPPWYKPAAIVASLKYKCMETIAIGGSLINLALLLTFHPFYYLEDKILDKACSGKEKELGKIKTATTVAALLIPFSIRLIPYGIVFYSEKYLLLNLRENLIDKQNKNRLIINNKEKNKTRVNSSNNTIIKIMHSKVWNLKPHYFHDINSSYI